MSQLVRIKRANKVFEVITTEGLALKLQQGKMSWSSSILASEEVFRNFGKGLRAGEKELRECFPECACREDVVRLIVEKGDIQVSADERKEALESKVAEVLQHLCKNYVDPASGLPHPRSRLEEAMRGAKFRVDTEGSASKQAAELVRALEGKLVFARNEREAELSVGAKYMGAVGGIVHARAAVKSERFTAEGAFWEVGVAPSEWDALVSALNKVTQGDYQLTLKLVASTSTSNSTTGKKKKGKK
jgi:ribosome maturation protein SDO1